MRIPLKRMFRLGKVGFGVGGTVMLLYMSSFFLIAFTMGDGVDEYPGGQEGFGLLIDEIWFNTTLKLEEAHNQMAFERYGYLAQPIIRARIVEFNLEKPLYKQVMNLGFDTGRGIPDNTRYILGKVGAIGLVIVCGLYILLLLARIIFKIMIPWPLRWLI